MPFQDHEQYYAGCTKHVRATLSVRPAGCTCLVWNNGSQRGRHHPSQGMILCITGTIL